MNTHVQKDRQTTGKHDASNSFLWRHKKLIIGLKPFICDVMILTECQRNYSCQGAINSGRFKQVWNMVVNLFSYAQSIPHLTPQVKLQLNLSKTGGGAYKQLFFRIIHEHCILYTHLP